MTPEHQKGEETFSQVDDNQDEFGRDVNDPRNRIGDKATVNKTRDVAHEGDPKGQAGTAVGRDRKVSGGFDRKQ